jgi:hypothetical protein
MGHKPGTRETRPPYEGSILGVEPRNSKEASGAGMRLVGRLPSPRKGGSGLCPLPEPPLGAFAGTAFLTLARRALVRSALMV